MKITESGSALLAVLWLSAALSAIAFSVAATVRGETERAATTTDGVRAYYLATGSVERAALWMFWGLAYGYRTDDGKPRYYSPPMPRMNFELPAGRATVDVIPEGGKLNVNVASPNDLNAVLAALGVDAARAQAITAGIIAWRTAGEAAQAELNFSLGGSSFQPRHASLEELEEILLIPGMTPDIFYGRYDHDPSGRLIPRGGLRDCLTVWGAAGKIDVNTAPPVLLEALGIPPQTVALISARLRPIPRWTISRRSSAIPAYWPASVSVAIRFGRCVRRPARAPLTAATRTSASLSPLSSNCSTPPSSTSLITFSAGTTMPGLRRFKTRSSPRNESQRVQEMVGHRHWRRHRD
jgi:general secretion pathway protein K